MLSMILKPHVQGIRVAAVSLRTTRRCLGTVVGKQHIKFLKERVVILGSGWAGYEAAMALDKDKHNVTMISPANHKVFTPMLPSSATGYVDFECITEPVRNIKGIKYKQAKARDIDFEKKVITCEDIFKTHSKFEVTYDKLIIAVGSKTNTFNTPGITESEGCCVFFLKHVYHAVQIKSRILEVFERADIPGITEAEKKRLLSFIVVGGGPTSCEFTADLHDFITKDVERLYPDLMRYVSITIVEAGPQMLSSFDSVLQQYTRKSLEERNVNIRLNCGVLGVDFEAKETAEERKHYNPFSIAKLSDGSELPFGCMVWSAGLAPVKLISALDGLDKGPSGRLMVDSQHRLRGHEGFVWAIGDCSIDPEHPQPPIAQAAQQQALYVANNINCGNIEQAAPFKPAFMGSMANLGFADGVLDTTNAAPWIHKLLGGRKIAVTGPLAWFVWKGAYWILRQVSWKNRFLIPAHWIKSLIFGRDISRYF